MDIAATRLGRQLHRFDTPARAVAYFVGVQAQEYLSAKWAVGLRMTSATDATIEAAIADGTVIRTHAFRWTWQYLAREDVRWVLGLVGHRVIEGAAGGFRQFCIDAKTLGRCGEVLARALAGTQLTRDEVAAVLARAKLPSRDQPFLHVLGHAELAGVICSGARRGKQQTFALLD